jgi:hypothetical protein
MELVLTGGNRVLGEWPVLESLKSTANPTWTALGVNLRLRVESALTMAQTFVAFYIWDF